MKLNRLAGRRCSYCFWHQLNRLVALQKNVLLQQEHFGDQSSVSSFQIWAMFFFFNFPSNLALQMDACIAYIRRSVCPVWETRHIFFSASVLYVCPWLLSLDFSTLSFFLGWYQLHVQPQARGPGLYLWGVLPYRDLRRPKDPSLLLRCRTLGLAPRLTLVRLEWPSQDLPYPRHKLELRCSMRSPPPCHRFNITFEKAPRHM